jgi:hypothetical protein
MIFTQLSKRERFFFVVTVTVIVTAVAVNFIIVPAVNKWSKLNSQIITLSTKLSRYERILETKKSTEDKYGLYGDYIKIKGSGEEAQANVLQEIEGLSRRAGVTLLNIVPANLENKDFYSQFSIRIELEAGVLPLCRFLYEIQNSKQLLGTERLNISAKAGNPELLRCTLQLTKIFIP